MLEEDIAGVRDIDLGLMMGTGMLPGPFARADFRGLDGVLVALEKAQEEWGDGFEPPLVLRRLVAKVVSARRAARASTRTRSPTRATRARR